MLDIGNPFAKQIFAASRFLDSVLIAARDMTVAYQRERMRLRDGCTSAFAELRRLSREQFADRPNIPAAITAFEEALEQLANLPGVPETGETSEYECPACGTALRRLDRFGFPKLDKPELIYCSPCLDVIMPALNKLRSWDDGFGTDAI